MATWQVDNLAFQYPQNTDTNTSYVLLVHGWNMQTWEKDRYAETAYKRIYWQGYHGRFGFYRWPTGNGISDTMDAVLHARNYDNSESNAWASATGLTNLLTQLNAEYPGNVYLLAHSMGNVVAGEALRKASSQLVNTYIAMQGAVSAHGYDSSTANYTTRSVPDVYAHYWTAGAPSYFSTSAGAGAYVNFYNTNDFALSKWLTDQYWKPDNGVMGFGANFPGYFYSTPSGTHPSGFYKIIGSTDFDLDFTNNNYEILAYGVSAWSFALGAQTDVGGVFSTNNQVSLPSVWPVDTHNGNNYSAHVWHSAEFRSDNTQRWQFWNEVLIKTKLKLQ